MKKYLFAILIIILPGYALHAGEPAPSSFDIKLGFSYFNVGHHSPEAAALDSSYAFNLGLDKYFSLGFETGLNWTRWDCYSPRAEKSGLEPGDRKTAADALTLPLMLNAVVHYDLRKDYFIMPYVAAGAGYSWSFFFHPDQDKNYGGFTWQVMAGTSIQPRKDYFAEMIVEAGYRGSSLTAREGYKLDLSGFVFRAGVRFSLGRLGILNSEKPETPAMENEATSPQ